MLHQLINKVVRLLGILLITSLLSSHVCGQKSTTHLDSVSLKKEIDSILSKYGLKTKGFIINVISVDQKGGQTAYSITNNYYGDTVNSATNFGFDTVVDGNILWVTVYPLKGVWQSPFVGIDSLTARDYIFDPGAGVVTSVNGFLLNLQEVDDSTEHPIGLIIPQGIRSKNTPLTIGLKNKNGFFVFGDFADDNKVYLFRKGKISHIPKKGSKK